MSIKQSTSRATAGSFFTAAALCVWILSASAALGQGPMGGGGMGGGHGGGKGGGGKGGGSAEHRDTFSEHYRGDVPKSHATLTLHGGQYLTTEENRFEVVYMPLQTRIYVYDKSFQPQSARDVHVQMSLQFPDEREARRIPFRYIPAPPGLAQQDYVVAVLDVSLLKDKETPITFQFSDLPDRKHPTASFAPVFTQASVRPYVAQVLATKADADGVMRQRVCPVCGEVLGSKGPVVKLLIAEYPLYLCGEECIAEVRQSPERYLPPQPTADRR